MRIIFAINLKQGEEVITNRLGHEAEIVFTATYREALIHALPENQADILIVRDKLNGDIPFIKMLQDIRHEYSEMRIIVITGDRRRGDKEIAQIVGLGIYDIICKDSLPIAEVITCCWTPRLFRDVSQYYLPDYIPEIEPEPEVEAPKKKGFMAGILGGGKGGTSSVSQTVETTSAPSAPQMNVELLRKTMKEEAMREAQRDVDGLIESAVKASQMKSDTEILSLKKEIEEVMNKLGQRETKLKQLNTQLTIEKQNSQSLKQQLENHFQETKEGFKVYEEQLSSLKDGEVNTPAWYGQQQEKFASREKELISEITRLRDGMKVLDDQRKNLEEEIQSLSDKLEDEESEKVELVGEKAEELDEMSKKIITLESRLKAEIAAKQQAEKESRRIQLTVGEGLGNDTSPELVLALQRDLEDAQNQLECALASTNNEPVIKYVEKVVEKSIPMPGVPDPVLEGVLKDLRRDKTQLTMKVEELNNELEEVKALNKGREEVDGLDYSTPSTLIPIIPDASSYVKSSSPVRLVVMASAKHGVGNTTIALNLATQLARQGKKTLLMEFNNKHPMTNCFFELMNVPLGISDALASIGSDPSIADASIIRFHGLSSVNKNLIKTYKKLPPGLHLMTYPNKDLVSRQKSYPTREGLYALLQYLLNSQQYAHIIMDIQPDEYYILDAVIESGIDIDKLVLTTSQDPHGISTIGKLTSSLMAQGVTSLLGESELVINRYSRGYTSSSKIAKSLNFNPKNVSTISDDTEGYVNASAVGIPYLLTKGHFKAEYDQLYSKIW